jgi:hypothetical protein
MHLGTEMQGSNERRTEDATSPLSKKSLWQRYSDWWLEAFYLLKTKQINIGANRLVHLKCNTVGTSLRLFMFIFNVGVCLIQNKCCWFSTITLTYYGYQRILFIGNLASRWPSGWNHWHLVTAPIPKKFYGPLSVGSFWERASIWSIGSMELVFWTFWNWQFEVSKKIWDVNYDGLYLCAKNHYEILCILGCVEMSNFISEVVNNKKFQNSQIFNFV